MGLEGFGFQTVLQGGAAKLAGYFYVAVAGGVETFGIPAEGLGLFYRALDQVAQRAGPVDGVGGA